MHKSFQYKDLRWKPFEWWYLRSRHLIRLHSLCLNNKWQFTSLTHRKLITLICYFQFVSKAEALHKQHSRRPQSTPHTIHSRASTVDTNTLLNHSLKIQDWLNDKKVKDVQVRKKSICLLGKQYLNARSRLLTIASRYYYISAHLQQVVIVKHSIYMENSKSEANCYILGSIEYRHDSMMWGFNILIWAILGVSPITNQFGNKAD